MLPSDSGFGSSAPLRPAQLDSSLNFDRPEPVLVEIVPIRDLGRQGTVAIALPSTAKVNRVVDPADFIIPADAQRCRIILAIIDIRKSDMAQNRRIERARRAKTINTECIVPAVLAAPLAMID